MGAIGVKRSDLAGVPNPKEVPDGRAALRAPSDELSLKLDFESVVAGCANAQVTLRRVDDKTISGKRGNAELVLVRN